MTNPIKKTLFLSALLFSIVVSGEGQDLSGGLATKPEWKQYLLSPNRIAVSLPKHPTVSEGGNPCESSRRFVYAAYASDAVYTVVVTREWEGFIVGPFCSSIKKFGKTVFEDRVKDLLESRKLERRITPNDASIDSVLIENASERILLTYYPEQKVFVELWVTSYEDRIIDEKHFFTSVTLKPPRGLTDTKGGVKKTVGDLVPTILDPSGWKSIESSQKDHNVRVIHTPKAEYTEAARRAKEKGTVRLKVTFLANGSIGAVTPETKLKFGLTEQAIAAAERILFLPKKEKGVNQNAILTLEYVVNIF